MKSELYIMITLRALNPSEGDDWRIEIDGEPVADIVKERPGKGLPDMP